ncbi:filament-like plant protein 7 isoform X2 [Cinnamomum micranthum f. kanehirae]|uniref:Filament-like plant protein 7 isoform X2 n=1 Tax=Cinnamomum micranthum f. kanehirae TaxID=337451 RepID=A0A443NWV8_9MAGN|nr:filament-like plant protein 7 isoform X2 [Cinnamomum micranthum f. kanehirae]
MEHKTWLWKKKSSEKTIVESERGNFSSRGSEQEMYVADKAQELEISVQNLNEKLSSALSECNAKDDLVINHMKVAEEAIAGWEKAEAEAECYKLGINDALRQRAAAEERAVHLEAALKECMQQLRLVREEQEKRIHDAVMKTTKEFDNVRLNLEEKLAETSKRHAKLGADNAHISKLLQIKENLNEDLKESKSQVEADFDALNVRLNSSERENASLRYEVCMFEKELEIRNDEREYNRKSIDVSHKQHLESMKKTAKLETECHKLRLLVQKRLPGPAALAKMRNEVSILRKEAADTGRKSNPAIAGRIVKDSMSDNFHDSPSKRSDLLIEQLCGMEEENKVLKEKLMKKNSDLQSLRTMYSSMASKLSQVEAQLAEMSKGQTSLELARSVPMLNDALASIYGDGSNEDEIGCAESWASALLSELDHFRNGKPKGQSCKSSGASDLSLMDDFVEMERLAIVAMDKPVDSSRTSSDEYSTLVRMEPDLRGCVSSTMGKELVPIPGSRSGFGESNQEMESKYQTAENSPSWIQNIWVVILQQSCITQRSIEEIIEEVQIALTNMRVSPQSEVTDARKIPNISSASDPSHVTHSMNTSSMGIRNRQCHSNLNKSISKVIELIEGIKPSLADYRNQNFLSENGGNSTLYKDSTTPTGYMVRVFQWKSSELSNVLQNFVHICNDLLHGKAGLEIFAGALTSTLDWIMNHCFSLQDVSSMKDTIKKHFELDDMHSESELEVGVNSPHSETEKLHACEECKHKNGASLLLSPYSKGHSALLQTERTYELKLIDEIRRLKDQIIKMESTRKELEERLELTNNRNEALVIGLQESERSIASLQVELEKFNELDGLIEDQIESLKVMNEDLDTQLTLARIELKEARQKFSYLEVEFEHKSHCCEELEVKCLELQLQLESVASKGISSHNVDLEHNQLRTDWQISTASEKLAECQETILSLGKQLKALASPRDVTSFEKVVTTPAPAKINHRTSLLDQMLADNDARSEEPKSPKTKEIICTGDPPKINNPNFGLFYGQNLSSLRSANNTAITVFQGSPIKIPRRFFCFSETKDKAETAGGSLAIVPKRQSGGSGLLRRLLMRKKKESSKKAPHTIGV